MTANLESFLLLHGPPINAEERERGGGEEQWRSGEGGEQRRGGEGWRRGGRVDYEKLKGMREGEKDFKSVKVNEIGEETKRRR